MMVKLRHPRLYEFFYDLQQPQYKHVDYHDAKVDKRVELRTFQVAKRVELRTFQVAYVDILIDQRGHLSEELYFQTKSLAKHGKQGNVHHS